MASTIDLYDNSGNPQSISGDDIADGFGAIGVGQTWQDVMADRELNVNYTNDTGRPIMLDFYGHATNETSVINAVVDGNSIGFSVGSAFRMIQNILIPTGSTYKIVDNGDVIDTIYSWNELREVA